MFFKKKTDDTRPVPVSRQQRLAQVRGDIMMTVDNALAALMD